MSRRIGALHTPAPPASLALALSFLIALAALVPTRADSAKRTQPVKAVEPAAVPPVASSAPGEPASATPVNQRQAERLARRRERTASSPAAPDQTSTNAPAAGPEGRAGSRGPGNTHRHNGARRGAGGAERSTGGEAPGGESQDATGVAQPQALSPKAKARKEREREDRRREREERRERSGRETHKEREAREAEEAHAAEGPALIPVQSAGMPPVLLAVAATATPAASTATTATGPPAIVGEHSVRSSISSRAAARRHHAAGSRHGGAVVPTLPATLSAAAATLASAHPTQARKAPVRHSSRPRASSPLVTTVTRIIGVIPTALWLLIGALALAAAAFATTSRLAARRAERLDRQRRDLLADVGLLQAALLPELPGRVGPVATSAAYRPASGPGAGGDFYDVFALEDGTVGVIVGDVSGHGRDALPHTTLLRYTLRTYLEAGLSPREALRGAAPALERQLGGSFATVVLARFDPRERLLTYSCAGHPHPILTGLAHDAAIIACSAPPIGAGRPTGTRQTVVSVPGASVACFYTDGVIEARTGGELYGQSRLAGALGGLGGQPTAASLLDSVREGTDRRPDDMAACLLGISGGEARPKIRVEQIELDGREAGRGRTRRFLLAAGVPEEQVAAVLDSARAIAADHGSALLELELGEGPPRMTLTHDNVAPLRARALARTQEVAL